MLSSADTIADFVIDSSGVTNYRIKRYSPTIAGGTDMYSPLNKVIHTVESVSVGRVIPENYISSFCKDLDGCKVTIGVKNWDSSQPGNIASQSTNLFISETSNWFRFGENVGGPSGNDNDGVAQELNMWDCIITDAETSTGSNNERQDNSLGFGLLNARAGITDDTRTTCVFIFED